VLVLSGGDAFEVLDAAEGVLGKVAVTVSNLVVDDLALAVDAAWNEGHPAPSCAGFCGSRPGGRHAPTTQ
jgi:hypothetical protein